MEDVEDILEKERMVKLCFDYGKSLRGKENNKARRLVFEFVDKLYPASMDNIMHIAFAREGYESTEDTLTDEMKVEIIECVLMHVQLHVIMKKLMQ